MTQLAIDAKLSDIIASLQSSEGANQKAELASVIGLPTNTTDEVAVQVTNLNNIKNNMVTALVGRGKTVEYSTPMATLASLGIKDVNCIADNIRKGIAIDGIIGSKLQYGIGDVVPLNSLHISKSFNGTAAQVPYFCVYEDEDYCYIVYNSNNTLYKYTQRGQLVSTVVFYTGQSTSTKTTYAVLDGTDLYMCWNYSTGSYMSKVSLATMTKIWEKSLALGVSMDAMYVDETYIYFVGHDSTYSKWGKILKDSTGLVTADLTKTVTSSQIECAGKYVYNHDYNTGTINKIDITTNTIISTWTPTTIAKTFGIPMPDVDVICYVKSDGYFYLFSFGNNVPIYSIYLSSAYGTAGSSDLVCFGFTNDKKYVYITHANGALPTYKIRLSDGAILSQTDVFALFYLTLLTNSNANSKVFRPGLHGFWTGAGSNPYHFFKLAYEIKITE